MGQAQETMGKSTLLAVTNDKDFSYAVPDLQLFGFTILGAVQAHEALHCPAVAKNS